jgi:hypothetical protein
VSRTRHPRGVQRQARHKRRWLLYTTTPRERRDAERGRYQILDWELRLEPALRYGSWAATLDQVTRRCLLTRPERRALDERKRAALYGRAITFRVASGEKVAAFRGPDGEWVWLVTSIPGGE